VHLSNFSDTIRRVTRYAFTLTAVAKEQQKNRTTHSPFVHLEQNVNTGKYLPALPNTRNGPK